MEIHDKTSVTSTFSLYFAIETLGVLKYLRKGSFVLCQGPPSQVSTNQVACLHHTPLPNRSAVFGVWPDISDVVIAWTSSTRQDVMEPPWCLIKKREVSKKMDQHKHQTIVPVIRNFLIISLNSEYLAISSQQNTLFNLSKYIYIDSKSSDQKTYNPPLPGWSFNFLVDSLVTIRSRLTTIYGSYGRVQFQGAAAVSAATREEEQAVSMVALVGCVVVVKLIRSLSFKILVF